MGWVLENKGDGRKYLRNVENLVTKELERNNLIPEFEIDGHIVDVGRSINYLCSITFDDILSMDEFILECVSDEEVLSNDKLFGNSLYEVEYASEEQNIIELFLGCDIKMDIYRRLMRTFLNEKIKARLVAVAVLLSKIISTTHGEQFCSTVNIHSAVVAYWAFNVNKRLGLKRECGNLVFTIDGEEDKLYKIEELTFKEFLEKIFNGRKEAVELALNYVYQSNENKDILDETFFSLSEEFIKVAKNQIKADEKSTQKEPHTIMFNGCIEEYDNTISEVLDELDVAIITKSNKENQIYASLARTFFILGYKAEPIPVNKVKFVPIIRTWLYPAIIADYNKWEKGNRSHKMKLAEISANTTQIISAVIASRIALGVLGQVNNRVQQRLSVLDKESTELKELKQKYTDVKKRAKSAEKDSKYIREEADKLSKKLEKLQKACEQEIKKEEYERVLDELAKRDAKIESLQSENLELTRSVNKREKEIEEADSRLDKLETEYLELLEKYDRERELNSKMAMGGMIENIPTTCFINAIRDKKIILIGGDPMHTRLKEYGVDNIKCYKAGYKGLTVEDMIHTDLIVVATTFVDHASLETVKSAVKNHKLKLYNFNNQNADMLICSIFEHLNS